ncbi:MAG: hypothetical protein U9N86_12500 [Bacteroidota bacterium]|nr:hypothetical protein [Bacteroidota bacterium]
MFITNMQHYLDENGNIAESMPYEAKALASFQSLVVDVATSNGLKNLPILTDLRCFEKGCEGDIVITAVLSENRIEWHCDECEMGGIISDWMGTKFDNTKQ